MFILLIILSICHFLADYTPLSTPWMLKAKQFGTPIFPIFCHALVHTILMGMFLCYFYSFSIPASIICLVCLFQLITHWVIDIGKGKINYYFPIVRDNTKSWYWMLFGFGQLLHIIVIIIMVKWIIT